MQKYENLFKIFVIGVGVANIIAIILAIYSGENYVLSTGDYPAFYSAGKIILEQPEKLYDVELQKRIQNEVANETLKGSFLPYSYPPHFALFLSIFGLLPYLTSKIIYSVFLLLIAVVSLKYIFKCAEFYRGKIKRSTELFLGAYFILLPTSLMGILGNQNTFITIFLLILSYYNLIKNKIILSGLFLSLLAYKPQYFALSLLFSFFIIKDRRFYITIICNLSLQYIVSAFLMSDLYWVFDYLKYLNEYRLSELHTNAFKHIGLISFLNYFQITDGYIMFIYLFLLMAILILLNFLSSKLCYRYEIFPLVMPFIVCFSPHSMYYDISIALCPLLIFINKIDKLNCLLLVLLLTILIYAQPGSSDFRSVVCIYNILLGALFCTMLYLSFLRSED